jgi:dTDP-4-dehydrorhamnose reductase
MKILLTGSNGFLGKIILDANKFHDIKTLSRHNSNFNVDLANQIPIFNENFDLVIHSAGKAHSIPRINEENIHGHSGLFDQLNGLKIAVK